MSVRSAWNWKPKMITEKLKPHPAAEIFPMMTDAEIADLAKDIKLRGQNRPIIVFEGKILDGRNRYAACKLAEVQPKLQEWNPLDKLTSESSPTAWVLSENLHRRHLTVDQRTLIALEATALFAKEAKQRQRDAGGDRKSKNQPDRLPPQDGKRSPTAAAQAAQTAGVSARSVERAQRVKAARPELLEKVRAGELTLKKAEKTIAKEERLKEVLAYTPPKGKFAVIAADPPWEYDDQLDGSDAVRGGVDYPTMTVDEICAMKVGETLATENCALWLWVTNAFVEEGYRVVREWGFKKVGLLTWRKIDQKGKSRLGSGRYVRNTTEHVIIAVRGRPLFRGENQPSDFAAPRGEHSEKPDEAFEIFERVTPSKAGARLDLFSCKTERKGWVTSGAEVSGAPGVHPSKRKEAPKKKRGRR